MMTYEEFEARLYELLDQRRPLDSDAELLVEAARTPEYQELLTVVKRLLETTAQLPLPTAPGAELNARVLAELRSTTGEGLAGEDHIVPAACNSLMGELPIAAGTSPAMIPVSQLHGTRGAMLTAMVLTTAAALLMGFFLWTGPHGAAPVAAVPEASPPQEAVVLPADSSSPAATDLATGDEVPTDPAAVASPDFSPESQTATPPELGTVAREASDRYRDLARETQKSLAEIALLLPGVSKPRGTSGDAATTSATDGIAGNGAASDDEAGLIQGELVAQNSAAGDWMAQFQESFRPLTDSSMGAFTSLLKGLPGGQGSQDGQGFSDRQGFSDGSG